MTDFDLIFKVVIVGDSGVGKTNLISRYLKNQFKQDSKATVGVEFGEKTLTFNNLKIKAQIWDTAGQERFRAITNMYYKGSKGALIVFDLTSKATFINAEKWLNEIRKTADPNINLILIGNKSDLKDKREIKVEEGEEKSREFGIAYMETSALNADNVDNAFNYIIEETSKRMKKELDEEEEEEDIQIENKGVNINLNNNKNDVNKKEKKNCCSNVPILKDKIQFPIK